MKKFLLYFLSILLLLLVVGILYFRSVAILEPPHPKSLAALNLKRTRVDTDFYTLGNSWIKKSNSGLWEMYVESDDAFERGVINGKLAQDLVQLQEEHFIAQLKKLIPSTFYLNYLKYVIAWFNRDLDKYVDE